VTVSREEFAMLRDAVTENARRLDSIDRDGTRGVGVVQQQLMDLKGDVTALSVRFDKHEEEHRSDAVARQSAKRWAWGAAIGAVASVAAMISMMVEILSRLH
jgi:hypothetical protein